MRLPTEDERFNPNRPGLCAHLRWKGMFVPSAGSSSWRQEGAIVMNKETGARYVYLGGQLRDTLRLEGR